MMDKPGAANAFGECCRHKTQIRSFLFDALRDVWGTSLVRVYLGLVGVDFVFDPTDRTVEDAHVLLFVNPKCIQVSSVFG